MHNHPEAAYIEELIHSNSSI